MCVMHPPVAIGARGSPLSPLIGWAGMEQHSLREDRGQFDSTKYSTKVVSCWVLCLSQQIGLLTQAAGLTKETNTCLICAMNHTYDVCELKQRCCEDSEISSGFV